MAIDLDSTAVARLKSFSLAAGVAICIVGLAALTGRGLHVAWLARIFSQQTGAGWVCPTAFAASGLAVVVWSRFGRALARMLGAITASIGAWHLVETLVLASRGSVSAGLPPRAGGMLPASSIGLMLVGGALLEKLGYEAETGMG